MLAESTAIGRYTGTHYLGGRCHLFALTAYETLGLPLAAWLDEEAWFEDLDHTLAALQHAFCQHPSQEDLGVDCRGALDLRDIEEEFACHANAPALLTGDAAKSLILEWIDIGLLEDFEPQEKAWLTTFIEEHRSALLDPPEEVPEGPTPNLF